MELCLAAPKGGELRELCYRWSVQRLPNYPQDKAKEEEEYWIQRDIERMNNRTSAMAADRSAGGWWAKLRGNGNGNGNGDKEAPSSPPPSLLTGARHSITTNKPATYAVATTVATAAVVATVTAIHGASPP